MITKFLYQMNVVNKRILTGLVENDVEAPYDPLREIPMVKEGEYKLLEGERVVSNFGEQFYGVFKEGKEYRYININDYMLKVKVDATDKVAFASSLSKDMIDSILDNTNYLGCDFDFNYVKSGFKLGEDKEFDDSFKRTFKPVDDDMYVEVIDGNTPKFLTFDDGDYKFVTDFSKALRVFKKEVRTLLVTHGIVSFETKRNTVFMSHHNIFRNDKNEYLFAGENSFKVSLTDKALTITKNPTLDASFRLVNDSVRAQALRSVMYQLKETPVESSHALMFNDKYVKLSNDLTFEFIENASEATLVSDTYIDLIKRALNLFDETLKIRVLKDFGNNYYLYNTDKSYELSQEARGEKSSLVSEENANKFFDSFKNDSKKNIIVMSNTRYLKINFETPSKFNLEYLLSGYNATVFSLEQVEALEKILNTKLYRRELDPTFNATKLLNITIEAPISTLASYNEFLEAKRSTSIRFGKFVPDYANLKVGSDKAAFEYLEGLYVKGILDTKNLLSKVFNKVNNILVVGSTVTLDLDAIAQLADENSKDINVSMLDTTNWGFYPKCRLGSHVKFNGAYRLEFESLTREFLSQFDCILISKKFSGNKEAILDLIHNLEENSFAGYILNLSLNKELGFANDFYKAIDGTYSFKRYIPHFNEEELYNDYKGASVLDNNLSYFSIFKIKNNKLTDIIKNSK